MQCRKQPKFLENRPTPITDLWEVRLPARLWREIVRIARTRGKTFSTITRFCVFALAERSSLRWHKKFVELHKEDKAELKAAGEIHRHMLCLYGEDVRLIRLAALELKITVSAFIRLALRFYLRYFAMEKQSRRYPNDAKLFWLGIKRWITITLHAVNELSLPDYRRYVHQSFPPEYRWGYPAETAAQAADQTN